MRNMDWKVVGTAVLAAVVVSTAIFAQSPTASTGSSGAVVLVDGNNHELGTVLGLTPQLPAIQTPNSFVVFRNGFFIAMQFGGRFPVGFDPGSQIFWTDANCTGDAYLNTGGVGAVMSRRMVIYSHQTNSLYVASGTGENTVSVKMPQNAQSIENGQLSPDGFSSCANGSFGRQAGYLLTSFDASRLGWQLSGDPLRVTAPVSFKQR